MGSWTYTFDGPDTADGAGIPVPAGVPSLEQVSGSWRRLNNRAYTSTPAYQDPILAITGGAGNCDITADVSSSGGDALYVRVTSADNWVRARVDETTYSDPYYRTEYQWRQQYHRGGNDYYYIYRWGDYSPSPDFPAGDGYDGQYGASVNSPERTGATRQVVAGYSYDYYYAVVLERCVGGAVTQLAAQNVSAPSRLRLRAVGTSLQVYVDGLDRPALTANDTSNLTSTRHGIGRGGQNGGSALDNVTIDTLNTPPNAAVITTPANSEVLDVNQDQVVEWTFSDDDLGDTQSAYEIGYWLLDAAGDRGDLVTTGRVTSTRSRHIIPAGTGIDGGRYELEVLHTYDAAGTQGPASDSVFFTFGTRPGAPTITAPSNNDTVPQNTELQWSSDSQVGYQVQVLDSSGAVLVDSGLVDSASTRVYAVSLAQNQVTRTLRVRTLGANGLWSAWATVVVTVAFTRPAEALLSLTPLVIQEGLAPSAWSLGIGNPPPSPGQPEATDNDVFVDDGDGWVRRATGLAPNHAWTNYTPRSEFDYADRIKVLTHGANGTSVETVYRGFSAVAYPGPDTYPSHGLYPMGAA